MKAQRREITWLKFRRWCRAGYSRKQYTLEKRFITTRSCKSHDRRTSLCDEQMCRPWNRMRIVKEDTP